MMTDHTKRNTSTIKYVDHVPDLMTWDDYEVAHEQKTIKVALRLNDDGIEILADSPYPVDLDKLLAALDAKIIEMMLCG